MSGAPRWKAPKQPKPQRGRVKPQSDRRAREQRAYDRERRAFLQANPECQIRWDEDCTRWATEVDHVVNRSQWRAGFTDPSNWQSACASCHAKKTENPREAQERGLARSAPPLQVVTRVPQRLTCPSCGHEWRS